MSRQASSDCETRGTNERPRPAARPPAPNGRSLHTGKVPHHLRGLRFKSFPTRSRRAPPHRRSPGGVTLACATRAGGRTGAGPSAESRGETKTTAFGARAGRTQRQEHTNTLKAEVTGSNPVGGSAVRQAPIAQRQSAEKTLLVRLVRPAPHRMSDQYCPYPTSGAYTHLQVRILPPLVGVA
jgi:hypothetical protein